jgi:hypothetical protein
MSRPGTEEVHVIVWTIEINISTSQFLFSCLIHFAPRFYASRSDLEPVPDAGYTFSPTRRKPLDPGWTIRVSVCSCQIGPREERGEIGRWGHRAHVMALRALMRKAHPGRSTDLTFTTLALKR